MYPLIKVYTYLLHFNRWIRPQGQEAEWKIPSVFLLPLKPPVRDLNELNLICTIFVVGLVFTLSLHGHCTLNELGLSQDLESGYSKCAIINSWGSLFSYESEVFGQNIIAYIDLYISRKCVIS